MGVTLGEKVDAWGSRKMDNVETLERFLVSCGVVRRSSPRAL